MDIVGYRHTTIWFCEYPCVLTSSLTFLLHTRLHTWLPVSTHESAVSVVVFQKRMHRSAVPPPDASSPCWCGDHAMAFTAAVWSPYRSTGCWELADHTKSWLSFPPDASSRSSYDHFKPHTSLLCPTSLPVNGSGARTSRCRMFRSRLPEDSVEELHASAPTRVRCPPITRTFLHLLASHICVSPWLVPTAR